MAVAPAAAAAAADSARGRRLVAGRAVRRCAGRLPAVEAAARRRGGSDDRGGAVVPHGSRPRKDPSPPPRTFRALTHTSPRGYVKRVACEKRSFPAAGEICETKRYYTVQWITWLGGR